jgi:hypothetical protein
VTLSARLIQNSSGVTLSARVIQTSPGVTLSARVLLTSPGKKEMFQENGIVLLVAKRCRRVTLTLLLEGHRLLQESDSDKTLQENDPDPLELHLGQKR